MFGLHGSANLAMSNGKLTIPHKLTEMRFPRDASGVYAHPLEISEPLGDFSKISVVSWVRAAPAP
jgi:hypothetical protein